MEFSRPGLNLRVLIKNARLIDPSQVLDQVADLYIADGLIAAIDKPPLGFKADHTLDAQGQLVIPGAIDICGRVREPGQSQKGTIHSETKAAAAGGVTHICCPPDSNPIVDTRAVALLIQERAAESGYAQVLPIGAMTRGLAGEQLAEMHALKEAGCVGVTQLRRPFKDNQVLLRCLEYARTFDLIVFFQSEDQALSPIGGVHAGATATRLGLPAIPHCAETIALSRDLQLVEHTGVRAHFGQLSCARSVELIADAQAKGLPVTADVAIHQLLLTEDRVDGFNGQYHVRPPLRTEQDRQALVDGVKSGVISMICSDHQPHEAAAKAQPFQATEAGISSIDSFVSLSYQLVHDGILTEAEWVQRIAMNPALLLDLDAGHLRQGSNANICVFDPEARWVLSQQQMLSTGKNSPFIGQTLAGQVSATLMNGAITRWTGAE